MLKRVGVLAMTLASLGAFIPATAAAAERVDHRESRAVVQRRDVTYRNHRWDQVRDRRIVVKHTPDRNIVAGRVCR